MALNIIPANATTTAAQGIPRARKATKYRTMVPMPTFSHVAMLMLCVIVAPLSALTLPDSFAAHLQQLQVAPQIIGGSAIGAFRFEGETSSGLGERQATDCENLAPEAWHPQGYDEPFEKTAAETQQEDGCLFWAPAFVIR